MRIMAIDYGDAHTGIAISDPTGFLAGYTTVIDAYRPRYLLHGHVHMSYGMHLIREREYHGTQVINVCEKYVIDIPKEECGRWKKPTLPERVKYYFTVR